MSLFFFVQWRKERRRMKMVKMADVIHQPFLQISVFAIRSCFQGRSGWFKL